MPSPSFGTAATASHRHVLLVEDNPGDADLACERLSEAYAPSFHVTRAATLAQATELLERHPVDAIVLDLNLPDSQGIETVRRIKIVVASAPIIAISGQVDADLRERALAMGADELFDKEETNSRLFWRSVLQIIERRRAQQRQFQALLDATPDAIMLVNKAGTVRYVNEAAVNLFGRCRDELLGEPLGFSVVDAEPTEITIPRPDGERACEMRVVRMDWDDEQAYLASIRDVTERKRAEELQARSHALALENQRVEAATRLKSQFLANMSHELRTPLNAILGFSQLLDDDVVDSSSPQYKVFIGHILTSGQHLLQMIDDILDLAKIEAGKLGFAPEPVDLLQLTQSVIAGLGSIAAQRGNTITLDFDSRLGLVHLDPARFKQVLYNYLSNALKFSHEGGAVTVRISLEDGQRFRLAVRDCGVGIKPSDISKLFAEFQQLDAGASKRHQGTGLGLALIKRLVEAQGGRVGVSSFPGQGSEFFALLPQAVPVSQAA